MKNLNQHQIREADQQTIALNRFPQSHERASKACADWLVERYENKQAFWIICGTGNNGGDGLVYRLLKENIHVDSLNIPAKIKVMII